MNNQLTNFSLTRYFVAASALVILIAAVSVSVIFSQLARQHMIEESEDDALSLTTHIEQEIAPALIVLLTNTEAAEREALQGQLESRLVDYHDLWGVVLVRLYDLNGAPIFSDAGTRLDFSLGDAAGMEQALAGRSWSEFEAREEISRANLAQSLPDYVVETYAPVYSADGQQIVGVLEVYRNVVADYEWARQMRISAMLTVTLAMSGLFALLSLIVRRGDRLLAKTNLRFGTVLATTADAIIGADESGRVTLWNDAARRMFGYSRQEIVGQPYTRLVAPEARKRFQLPSPVGDAPPRLPRSLIVTTAVHRDGAIFPVEISASAYRQGANYEFSAVVRDITKRRQAEVEIKRRIEELTILGSAAAAVNRSPTLNQMLVAALAEIEASLGLAHSEVWLLDRQADLLRPYIHYGLPDELAEEVDTFVLREGLPDIVAETGQSLLIHDLAADPYFMEQSGGRVSLQSALGVPLMAQERLVGVMHFFSDDSARFSPGVISCLATVGNVMGTAVERAWLHESTICQAEELRKLNEALKDHAAILEERVAERTAALEIALEKARESDRLKSEFVSNVNHELRTPLTCIKLSLDLLSRLPKERRARHMEILRRETLRLEYLIEDLLHLSRLDLGKIQPRMKAVDANQLLSTLITDRQTLIDSHGLELKTDWATDLPPIWADPNLINQVATNLLTNAVNYTPAGGQIVLATATRVVDGRTWATFSLADTGPGIDPDDLPHLFERFYRGRVGKATSAPGTGLGLAITKEILGLHKGRIEVHSQPGQGSTFVIWLPLADVVSCQKNNGTYERRQLAWPQMAEPLS